MAPSPLRCLGVWAAGTAVAAAVVRWLVPVAVVGTPDPAFDDLLVRLCAAVAILGIGWLWLASSLTILEAAHGRAPRTRGVPAPLRRVVLAACGAGLAAGLVGPAHATPGEMHTDHGPASAVAGLPLPDRAVGLPARASIGTGPVETLPPATRSIVVRPGDTLWDLAATHLGDPSRWPEIYDLNRPVIGDDPSLIHPATHLRLPADRPEETP